MSIEFDKITYDKSHKLAARFGEVLFNNLGKLHFYSLSGTKKKIKNNIRIAVAGFNRNYKKEDMDNVDYLKSKFADFYKIPRSDKEYDSNVIKGALESMMKLENRTMSKKEYSMLCGFFRKKDKENLFP